VLVSGPADAEYAGPEPTVAERAWAVSGEFCEPETVLPLPDDTFLVSNVCGYAQDGTGFLTLIDATGKVVEWRIVDDLDSPLGMALAGGTLFVIDRNTVRRFAWPGLAPKGVIELPTRVANDIAVAVDGTMYVSDSLAGSVVAVSPDGSTTTLESDIEFVNANGIAVDGKVLLIGGQRLWRRDLASGEVVVLGEEWLADIDGIEFEGEGVLQLTPVGGPVVRLFPDGQSEVLGGEGVSSANHGYSRTLRLAVVPTGFDNIVIALRVPQGESAE
jgi:hypothetical protein